MEKYEAITDDKFDEILVEILNEHRGGQLISIPGVYEILSEEFNNEILGRWAARQEEE